MNRFATFTLMAIGVSSAIVLPYISYAQVTYTGTVERVWEDGFRLNTGDRTLRVDSWDVYGDNTSGHVAVGDRITVTGEFGGREFDAFSIDTSSNSDTTTESAESTTAPEPVSTSSPVSGGQTSYTGTVEGVWEDGFRLNTGDRTFRVDSWDVYGDNTLSHVTVGDRITITGEFAGREFDAFSIDAASSDES